MSTTEHEMTLDGQVTKSDTVEQIPTPSPEMEHAHEPQRKRSKRRLSRRRVLGRMLGAAAAAVGAGTFLGAQTNVALANGKEGPTTFTSTSTKPAVSANNTGTGSAISATNKSRNTPAIDVFNGNGPGINVSNTSSSQAAIGAINQGSGPTIDTVNSGGGDTIVAVSSGSGRAIYGQNYNSGTGVYGNSTSGYGVVAESSSGTAVSAHSKSGYGAELFGGIAPLSLSPLGTNGPPTTGPHQTGEIVVDRLGTLYSCISSGAPGTWAALYDRMFNVRAFAAQGDGTTDDTGAIQNAINTAQNNGGGVVYFPPGVYMIARPPLVISQSNVSLVGAGQGATTLITSDTTNDIVQIGTGPQSYFRNARVARLTFDTAPGVGQRSGGAAIHWNMNPNGGPGPYFIEDVGINNYYSALIHDGGGGAFVNRLTGGNFTSGSGVAIWIRGGNDHYFRNCVFYNPGNMQAFAGIRFWQSFATWVTDCDFINFSAGMCIDPPSGGGPVTWLFILNSAFDGSNAWGIYIKPGANTLVQGVQCIGCWTSSGANYGVYAEGSVARPLGISLVGHRSFGNGVNNSVDGNVFIQCDTVLWDASSVCGNGGVKGGAGIVFAQCNMSTIRNCYVANGYGYPGNAGYGIYLAGPASNLIVIGNNTVGNGQPGNVPGAASIYSAGGLSNFQYGLNI